MSSTPRTATDRTTASVAATDQVRIKRTYHALRDARIEDVHRKGGFTYLRTEVNGIDVYQYERLHASGHTYELSAIGFVVIHCACMDFTFCHLPCKHCDALQLDLWEAHKTKLAQARRLQRASHGCWAELPVGSGCFVWQEEFGLTEAELRVAQERFEAEKFEAEKSNQEPLDQEFDIDQMQINQMQTVQRRIRASGLDIERKFRHAASQYTR